MQEKIGQCSGLFLCGSNTTKLTDFGLHEISNHIHCIKLREVNHKRIPFLYGKP